MIFDVMTPFFKWYFRKVSFIMETPGNDIEQQGGVKLGEGGFGAVYTPRIPCARGQGYDIIRDKGLVRRDDERLTVKDGMKSVSKVFKSVRDMRNESASLKVASKHLAKNFTDAERNKWFVMAEKQCTIPREFFESADEAAEVHGEQYGREWFADKSGRNAKLLPRISEPKQLIFPRGDFDIETIFETLEPKN